MTRTNERLNDVGAEPAAGDADAPPGPAGKAPRVLVVDADGSLADLFDEWLGAAGCSVAMTSGRHAGAAEPFDLVIVDVPFPRQGGVDLIARLTERHPMTPILVLSSTLFAGVDCCGAVARALGVAGVLPNPASREALISAVRRFLPI